jgi:hypothetical protein
LVIGEKYVLVVSCAQLEAIWTPFLPITGLVAEKDSLLLGSCATDQSLPASIPRIMNPEVHPEVRYHVSDWHCASANSRDPANDDPV